MLTVPKPRIVLTAVLVGAFVASAQTAGEKDTPLGAGQGTFSFEPELNRKIVVRHNPAAYNSGERHDDLMPIYLDAPNDTPRAIYFDTEGHVIRYSLTFPSLKWRHPALSTKAT